jgi:flagellar motor switch protein FliM
LRDTFEWIARELSAAWQPAGIGFRWTATGVGEAVPVPGALLVFDCRMDLGEVSATLGIAVPAFLARLAALQCAAAPPADGPAPARGSILSALRRAHATVEAVLCGSTLRMGDLLAMEPGHVLMLAQPAGSALECRVNGKTKFQGEWIGRGDGRQGLELL